MSSDLPAPPRGTPPSGVVGVGAGTLLFALLGGQSAYAVHLVASFWAVPAACRAGTHLPLHAITAVTLATAVAATAVAVRCWRLLSREAGDGPGLAPDTPPPGRAVPPADDAEPPPAARGYLAAVLLRRSRLAAALLGLASATRPPAPRPEPRRGAPAGRPRGVFMAGTGIVLNVLGVALIVFHGAAVLVIDACT